MFALLIAAPLLVICLAIPLILGKVPRNYLYGVRTTQSMAGSLEEWYAINRAGGIAMVVGALASLLAVLAFRLHGPIRGNAFGMLASTLPAFLLVSLGVALYRQQRSAKDLNP